MGFCNTVDHQPPNVPSSRPQAPLKLIVKNIPSARGSRHPTRGLLCPGSAPTKYPGNQHPGAVHVSAGVRYRFFLFLVLRWGVSGFCSYVLVLLIKTAWTLGPHSLLSIPATQHCWSPPPCNAPTWDRHNHGCMGPRFLSFSTKGRPEEGREHTGVGSGQDSQLHKCGFGIASMGYDSCLCSSDMIAQTAPCLFCCCLHIVKQRGCFDSILQLKSRGGSPCQVSRNGEVEAMVEISVFLHPG
jgi:hypothetical protein